MKVTRFDPDDELILVMVTVTGPYAPVTVPFVVDTGAAVTVRAKRLADNTTLTFQASWLIGCDGGQSVTRTALGLETGFSLAAVRFVAVGFDVDVGSLFSTPDEVARQAADNDVHVVGVSSLAAGHLTLVPALRDALAAAGRPDIMVVVGGVIPPGDFDELYAAGATAIFPPGTVIADAAIGLLNKLADRLGYDLS